MGPSLVLRDQASVYADRAYDSQAFRKALTEVGIADRIMHKAWRNKPLKKWQKWFNQATSPIRSAVKRSFATIKCHYGHYGRRRVRYIGLARNRCHLHPMCAAIDLRRALGLTQ